MAYPQEEEHDEYSRYRIRHDTGEEDGPRMTKEQWREKRRRELGITKEQDKKASAVTRERLKIGD